MKGEKGYRSAAASRMRSPATQEDMQPDEVDLTPMDVTEQHDTMQAEDRENTDAAFQAVGGAFGYGKKKPVKR